MAGKKKEDGGSSKPSGNPRFWTPEQRCEAFLKARTDSKEDYQVISSDYREELVPYGHLVYDYVLGLRGIARHGRVTQIHGDEGAGKSTNTYYIASKYQQHTGEPLAIFDFEATATTPYLAKLGIDNDLCLLKQPSSIEKAIKDTLDLIVEQGVRMFIYDSIPRMKSMIDIKDVKSNKAFKSNYGKHAQTMGRFYDILLPYFIEYDCGMLIVNQTRDRVDGDEYADKFSYTNKDYVLPGGRICRFTPSVMIELRMDRALTPIRDNDAKTDPFLLESERAVGHSSPVVNKVRARTLKSKVTGAGFRQGYIYVRPGFGVDEDMSVRELAREYGLINYGGGKSGWYVGKSKDEAIITYPTKEAAVEDLVINKNREVLDQLRILVADAIEKDDSARFAVTLTREEQALFEGNDDVVTGDSFEVELDEV